MVNKKTLQLRRHKRLATGLFILMALVYILMVYLQKQQAAGWMAYVEAFSEAAMVGALADWFAVTALFHHPLGLPIPHTNLIEKSKQSIGNNLGSFVVDNFLTSGTIRPYLVQTKVAERLGFWLSKQKNKMLVQDITTSLLSDVIGKLDDQAVARFISRKATDLMQQIPLQKMLGKTITYLVQQNEQEKWITGLAVKIQQYIQQEQQMVAERVKKESFFFVPKFVNNKLAQKISAGLMGYFEEIARDSHHKIRLEIKEQLLKFAHDLEHSDKWVGDLDKLKAQLVSNDSLQQYAYEIWSRLKPTLLQEVRQSNSATRLYISKTINDLAISLQTDDQLKTSIDQWLRHTAYKYIMRHTSYVAELISATVGNWEGRELSSKLELEVGKDLQFIRINGTLVGGVVGLLIYVLTQLIS